MSAPVLRKAKAVEDIKPFSETVILLLDSQRENAKFTATDLEALARAFKRQVSIFSKSSDNSEPDDIGIFTLDRVDALVNGVYGSYNSSDRQTSLKAGELVQSIAGLCRATRDKSHTLDQVQSVANGFVRKASGRESFDKHDLHVLNHLLPFADSFTWPDDLMERIFIEIWSNDSRFVAGRVLVSMFNCAEYIKRVHGGLSPSGSSQTLPKEDVIVEVIVNKVATTDYTVSLKPISQFVLPGLFETQPQVIPILLQRASAEVDNPRTLSSAAAIYLWIRVVASARTLSLIRFQDIDADNLLISMHHAIDDVRLAAWTALTACKAPSDRVELECLSRVREWFQSNMRVYNADFRGTFSAAFRKFVERLRLSATAAQKHLSKTIPKSRKGKEEEERAWSNEKRESAIYIDSVVVFLQDVLDRVLVPAIELPSMTGHARVITALDMIQSLASELDVPVDSQTQKDKVDFPRVYTEERVEHLLACLGGNFSDVRAKALDVLLAAPIPLPGYSSDEEVGRLLNSAYDRLDGNRKSDAEAGALVMQVLSRESRTQSNEQAIRYIQTLLARLERSIAAAEQDLVIGMQNHPMHGTLLAIARIISASAWHHTTSFDALLDICKASTSLVERIWNLSRSILSSEGSQSADHEIARIYEMLEDGIEEDDQDRVHIDLLSNCWRAIKESSNLLANIFVVTMGSSSVANKPYWSPTEIQRVGDTYIGWLYHIRHRGTFSSIAPDFERFINTVSMVNVPDESQKTLRQNWLDIQLAVVAAGTASTTRRSAAIPFCILALVQSSPNLFAYAHRRLVAIVESDETPDPAKVHALHTLRVIVLDARQTKILGDYFELTVLTGLSACKNTDWSVRNSALLLFAYLATRMFGKGLNSPGTVYDKRIGISDWNARYPSLLPSFFRILEQAISSTHVDSSAILILAILRHLESSQGESYSLEVHGSLRQSCLSLLTHSELKVRQAAAEAAAALTPKAIRLRYCEELLSSLPANLNGCHGHLLLVLSLMTLARQTESEASGLIVRQLQASLIDRHFPPLIMATATEIAVRFSAAAPDAAEAILQLHEKTAIGSAQAPGTSLWIHARPPLDMADPAKDPQDSETSLQRALQPGGSPEERIQALEEFQTQKGSNAIPHRLEAFERLSNLYANTAHIPLRESILPALGLVLTKHNQSGHVRSILDLVEIALKEEESVDSRFAACRTLRNLSAFISEGTIDGTTRIKYYFLVKQALSDDDVDIRNLAAEVVCKCVGRRHPCCRDFAVEEWWGFMQKLFGQESAWYDAVVGRIMDVSAIEHLVRVVDNPNNELFAMEAANLFFERSTELEEAYTTVKTMPAPAQDQVLHQRLGSAIKTLGKIQFPTSPVSPLQGGRDEFIILQRIEHILTQISASTSL